MKTRQARHHTGGWPPGKTLRVTTARGLAHVAGSVAFSAATIATMCVMVPLLRRGIAVVPARGLRR